MKLINFFLAIIIASLLFTSCAHSIYPIETLYGHYNSSMCSDGDLEIKGKVHIYMSEKDIKGDYTIISVNAYKPFVLLPFNSILVKKMSKKFFSEAVSRAYEEGGNAILVHAAGLYYVLNLTDWDADDAPAATFINPIYNTRYSDMIKNGNLKNMKRSACVRVENAFMDEIATNIENVKDLQESAVVRDKIDVLKNYYLTLEHPKKSIEKAVKKDTRKINRIEKKIHKAEAKTQQNN